MSSLRRAYGLVTHEVLQVYARNDRNMGTPTDLRHGLHSDTHSYKAGPSALRLKSTVALIAAMTFVFLRFIPVNALTAGFSYLVAILVLATAWGAVEAIIASLVAVACLNFFF